MDPIVANGISPSWVLTGVVSIMVILLWRMLTTMQKEIKEHSENIGKLNIIVGEHHVKHEAHVKQIDQHDEDLKTFIGERSKLADDIISKLRAAGRV